MPRVLNKHAATAEELAGAVYVGRPTKWGNPFSHLPSSQAKFRVSTREEAVAAYKNWIVTRPDLIEEATRELRGKNLVCWCAPKCCHGDILLEIANT